MKCFCVGEGWKPIGRWKTWFRIGTCRESYSWPESKGRELSSEADRLVDLVCGDGEILRRASCDSDKRVRRGFQERDGMECFSWKVKVLMEKLHDQ